MAKTCISKTSSCPVGGIVSQISCSSGKIAVALLTQWKITKPHGFSNGTGLSQ